MIIQPEELVTNLISENEKLRLELEEAEREIKNFEQLGLEWKRGYDKLKHESDIKIMHLEQIAEDLRMELKETYGHKDYLGE